MKKFIITENEKVYIKSLYGLLNEQSYGYDLLRASEVEPRQQPPIDVKLIDHTDLVGGLSYGKGFNKLKFICEKDIQLSFKVQGESYEFDKNYNIEVVNNDDTQLDIPDVNTNLSKIIGGLYYSTDKRTYNLLIRTKIDFNLEIKQKNSQNKTPFILKINNKFKQESYQVNLRTIKQINYIIRKLKSNEIKQNNFPFNKEEFLKMPNTKKVLVVIETPIDINYIEFTHEKNNPNNTIKKDNNLFIRLDPKWQSGLELYLNNGQVLKIQYDYLLPNETNYFVIEPKK